MKALIMAAGRGTRISRYIEGKPKCTVDIGGIKLIEYTIEELQKRGVTEIAMVLGYRAEILEELLKEYPIKFYYNYFYDVTNSIASTWFAKDFIDDDILLLNADVFLEPKLLDAIFLEDKSPILFSDSTRKEEADYKFYYEDNQLIKFGKELEGEDISGEYVGVAKINKEFLPCFHKRLEELIRSNKHFMWWEDVLYSYVGEKEIYVRDVIGRFWAEVDFIEDYERILQYRGYSVNYNITIERNLRV
ncbi:Choline kinase [Anaerosporobacter mobilis DSM 15930]|uniref:Choline kinase n=1 Tax=Anaerosporobacter mobilis DSM 15930 TaxID=1120996 RepID=A0A1M7LNV6_9FIRM|nr:phosphocholine cytidylyltransferase family protein [Anaerosporobacter mobilis]SHM79847.1 Choline kinase [Anaerosporobacter mobilis DSM 15930]